MNYFQFKLIIPHIAFKPLVVETSSFFLFLGLVLVFFFGGVHKKVSMLVVVVFCNELNQT